MANIKFSDAAAVTTIGATDVFPLGVSGASKKITGANLKTDVLSTAVLKSLYDANTVLAATTDDTPAAVTMGASTILARLAAGNIKAASVAEIATLLAPSLPGYQMGVIERASSNFTTTQTVAASADTALTMTSITFTGTESARFSLSCLSNNSGVGVTTYFTLWEDSTDLGVLARITSISGNPAMFLYGEMTRTPTAGAKVYTIRGYVQSASTGTMYLGNGTTVPPAIFRIVRMTV
jgi:hypothetical protein